MKKKVIILPLLLVGVIYGGHAHIIRLPSISSARTVTARNDIKDSAATTGTVDNQVKDIWTTTTSRSVVYDWNSVCEQLCRAGLGGPSCGPHCTSMMYPDDIRELTASHLLGSRKVEICNTLCQYELGGLECSCKSSRQLLPSRDLDKNTVCMVFCKANNITIPGCTVCPISAGNRTSTNFQPSQSNPANSNYPLSIASQPGGPNQDETLRNSTSATTPDWNEFCLSMCRIGEGGALCNCDLPPFF